MFACFVLKILSNFVAKIILIMRQNYIIDDDNCRLYSKFLTEKFESERTIRNYLTFVNSSIVMRYLSEIAHTDSIYKVEDFDTFLKLYLAIKEDKDNIRLHRVYSSAVSKYIKFKFPDKKIRKSY